MAYTIDFTDPLHGEFVVHPGTVNSPPSTSAKTPLNIYGKGALNWGEGVNENFLHLLEKFSGATSPPNPLIGQLWFCVRYYWINFSASPSPAIYWYNPQTNVWTLRTWSATKPTNPSVGDYWFDDASNVLYRYDRLSQAQNELNEYLHAPTWMQRYYTSYTGNPTDTPSGPPSKSMFVWNGEGWTVTSSVLAQGTQPTDVGPGSLWYDTVNRRLFMWDHTVGVWIALFLTTGTSSMNGEFDADNHSIVGVAEPIDGTDAANLDHLYKQVGDIETPYATELNAHITDTTRHLLPWQNSWIDAVADAVTGISAAEVNYLAGLNYNLQQKIDQLAALAGSLPDAKVNKSGDTMTGFLTVAGYDSGTANAQTQAIQKQYVDSNWRLKDLLDVDGASVLDGSVLRWNTVTSKWTPVQVANSVIIEITGTSPATSLVADGPAVHLKGYVVNSNNTRTEITAASGTTWAKTGDSSYVTMTTGSTVSLTAARNTPANTTATIRLTYNDGTVTKTATLAFPVATVTAISVSGPSSARHNQTVTFAATATLSNSTTRTITGQCTWEFPVGTAKPSNSFIVPTSVPLGTQNVRATYTGTSFTATLPVNVLAGASSITISGPTSLYEGGGTIALSASVAFTVGSPVNVTSSSSWAIISGPGSINSSGVYTAPANVSGDTGVTVRVTNTTYGVTVIDDHAITVLEKPAPGAIDIDGPTSGSFTIPATYTNIRIYAVGGGGGAGGGYGNSYQDNGAGQGGGAGQYTVQDFTVPAGSAISYTVGAGGAGGVGNGWGPSVVDGKAGGGTSVYGPGISISLAGGCGGWGSYQTNGETAFYSRNCLTNNSCASLAVPNPNTASVPNVANGANGAASSYPGSQGGQGSAVWAHYLGGGVFAPSYPVGDPAVNFGKIGGGGGGGGITTNDPNDAGMNGGYGGNGRVRIEWIS